MSHIFLVFRKADGSQAHIRLPWKPGRTLKHYLHEQPARGYHLIGRLLTSKALGKGRRKLRFTSTLEPDETVHIVRVRQQR
jgi:hypothetical protein